MYGIGPELPYLNKELHLKNKLNIIGISDKKFEKKEIEFYQDFKVILPKELNNEDYDAILVTREYPKGILSILRKRINKTLVSCFAESVPREQTNLSYLYANKFDKTLPKLIKDLKGKKVLLYGAGVFLALINKYFDLSSLNIIGISDKRFNNHTEGEKFLDWNVYSVDEINDLKPDCVFVTTRMYANIIRYLHFEVLDENIPVRPLLEKGFFTLLRELWRYYSRKRCFLNNKNLEYYTMQECW